jgi:hypothetical protein
MIAGPRQQFDADQFGKVGGAGRQRNRFVQRGEVGHFVISKSRKGCDYYSYPWTDLQTVRRNG